jgi:hypothetical protein
MPKGAYAILGNSDNLRMLLQLPEHLLAQGIGDLGVDAGVLDVLVAQVVGHVFNSRGRLPANVRPWSGAGRGSSAP